MLLDAYQRLIIVLKFREGLELGPFVRSDVIYLRMFKDVPHVDMEMHLPEQGTKVKMRMGRQGPDRLAPGDGRADPGFKLLGVWSAALGNPWSWPPS